MTTEKLFLQSDFSLPHLADRLKLSVHIVSQVITDGLGKSFFEMTAEYRVEAAKHLLKDQPNIKIEEIAEQVGYNSKFHRLVRPLKNLQERLLLSSEPKYSGTILALQE